METSDQQEEKLSEQQKNDDYRRYKSLWTI